MKNDPHPSDASRATPEVLEDAAPSGLLPVGPEDVTPPSSVTTLPLVFLKQELFHPHFGDSFLSLLCRARGRGVQLGAHK